MTVRQMRKILKGLPPDLVIFFQDEDQDLIELCAANVEFTDFPANEDLPAFEAIIFGECLCGIENDEPPTELPVIPDKPNLN